MARIAVLASGTGSLLDALIADGIKVDLVVVDRECRAYSSVAKKAEIPRHQINRDFPRFKKSGVFNRTKYTDEIIAILKENAIDIVVMAGWLTIFSEQMFRPQNFGGWITNNHPSLLPAFPGKDAVAQALAHRVKVTGCTIHMATADLDAGPIIAQEPVPVLEGDTVDSLSERIKEKERPLLCQVVRALTAKWDAEHGART